MDLFQRRNEDWRQSEMLDRRCTIRRQGKLPPTAKPTWRYEIEGWEGCVQESRSGGKQECSLLTVQASQAWTLPVKPFTGLLEWMTHD